MAKLLVYSFFIVCLAMPLNGQDNRINFKTNLGYSYLLMSDHKQFIRSWDGENRSGNIQLAKSISLGADLNLTRKLSLSLEASYLSSNEENELWLTPSEKIGTRKDTAFTFPIISNLLVGLLSTNRYSLKLGGGIGYYPSIWKLKVVYSGLMEAAGTQYFENEGRGAGLQIVCDFYIDINTWFAINTQIIGRLVFMEFPSTIFTLDCEDFSGIEGKLGVLFHLF